MAVFAYINFRQSKQSTVGHADGWRRYLRFRLEYDWLALCEMVPIRLPLSLFSQPQWKEQYWPITLRLGRQDLKFGHQQPQVTLFASKIYLHSVCNEERTWNYLETTLFLISWCQYSIWRWFDGDTIYVWRWSACCSYSLIRKTVKRCLFTTTSMVWSAYRQLLSSWHT